MNKTLFRVTLLLLTMGFVSCVSDLDVPAVEQEGRLQLSLENISTTTTRSTPSEIGAPVAADFHMNLTTKSGYKVYDGPFTEEEKIVPIGDYNITVSYGTDDLLAIDKPYYIGTTTTTVRQKEITRTSVSCKVGNALISAVFGKDDEDRARFERYYSDYALYAYVGDKGMAIYREGTDKSIYVRAGSHVTLRFWGKLKMENDREVICDLSSSNFPDVLSAAEHSIITLTLPDPESAITVDISKVQVENVTLEETIPLSWLPVPMATAEHLYVRGILTGTDITFSNSYPGMEWKAVLTNAAGETLRTVQGVGALAAPYSDYSNYPYLPQGKYKATYYLVYEDGTSKVASSREFMVPAPTLSITTGGYTSYDRYLAGDVSGANSLDGRTIYDASCSLNIASSLLMNPKYPYTFTYTYDGTTTNVTAGSNSYTSNIEDQAPKTTPHILTANATFDGVSVFARKDYTVTGIPYSLNLASHDEWTSSSSVDWFENDVRLGKNSTSNPQYIQTTTAVSIPPSTSLVCDYSVNVHTATSGTTFSIEVGSNEILSIEESGKFGNVTGTDHVHTGTTEAFKDDNNYATQIYCKNSYGLAQTCSHLYSLTLKYAKP